jgi:hypothetical protein
MGHGSQRVMLTAIVILKLFVNCYIRWYNHHRRHSALKKQKPYEVMTDSINILCGKGENPIGFTPSSTKSTSTPKLIKNIKKTMNLSSKFAA